MADVTGTGLVITPNGGTVTGALRLNNSLVLDSPNIDAVSGTITGNVVIGQRSIFDRLVAYTDVYITSNAFGGPYGRLFWSDGIDAVGAPNAPAWEAGMTPEDGYYWSVRRLGGSSGQGTLTGAPFQVKVDDLAVYIGGAGTPVTQVPHRIAVNGGSNTCIIQNFGIGFSAHQFNDASSNECAAEGFGGDSGLVPATDGCAFDEASGFRGSMTMHVPRVWNVTYKVNGSDIQINNKRALWKNQDVLFADGAGVGWTGPAIGTIPGGTLTASKVVGMADGSGNQYHKGVLYLGGTITTGAALGNGVAGSLTAIDGTTATLTMTGMSTVKMGTGITLDATKTPKKPTQLSAGTISLTDILIFTTPGGGSYKATVQALKTALGL